MNIKLVNYILLIYPILLLVCALYRVVLYKGKTFSPKLWDKEQAKMLQAVACIAVILHHLTQEITSYGSVDRGPITILSSMGILFTAIFFFFTGYGLILSVLNNPDYLKNFLRHRLTVILVPFFTANAVCVLIRIFYSHIPTSAVDIVRAVFGITLLNGNGWYFVEVFWLYIFFYLIFRIVKSKNIAIVLLCVASLIMIYYAYGLGHDYSDIGDRPFYGEWWYNSTIAFPLGVLFARFRDRIITFLQKGYWLCLTVISIAFVVAFTIEERILRAHGYYSYSEKIAKGGLSDAGMTLIAQMIACVFFVLLILLLNMKLEIHNPILKALSGVTTEIFLLHGLFINTIFDFKNVNDVWMYAIVLACSIPAGALMHLVNAPICKVLQCNKKVKIAWNKAKVMRWIGLLVIIGLLVLGLYLWLFRPALEARDEEIALREAKVGDYVYLGRYEMDYGTVGKERVPWIVLRREEDCVQLLSVEGLCGGVYNRKHQEISWADSDIRKYLQNEMLGELFSRQEQKMLMANEDTGDLITLLTAQEAEAFWTKDEDRQLRISESAERSGTNINVFSKVNYWDNAGYRSSWWWLRGETTEITAPIVTVDGEILINSKYVNRPNGAIRPVVWVRF